MSNLSLRNVMTSTILHKLLHSAKPKLGAVSVCAALRLCAADLRRWVQASAASAATVEAQAQEAVGPGGETASKGSLGPPFEPERPGPKWRSKHPRPRARPGTEPQPGASAWERGGAPPFCRRPGSHGLQQSPRTKKARRGSSFRRSTCFDCLL